MGNMRKKPAYLTLYEQGGLEERVTRSRKLLHHCQVCPHECGVDRPRGELGICQTGYLAQVSSYGPHFGEESPLVGEHGSGTIFFAGCNLLCVFCQNYEISHIDGGGDDATDCVDDRDLAAIMLELQAQGCENINLVTPSHLVPQILAALPHAIDNGLHIPLVYNSSGYDALATLRLLDGVVDIYMPDCKFWTEESSRQLTRARNYPQVMRCALKEMHAQVGELEVNERGVAVKGLLVRHLLMPGHGEETRKILEFIAREISPHTFVNIMDQYRPCGRAREFDGINHHPTANEYAQAREYARQLGLTRLYEHDLAALLRHLGIK